MFRNSRNIVLAIAFFAFIGFADATYLTMQHFLSQVPPCAIAGCEVVLTSQYAVLSRVPVALLGALFYVTIFIVSVYYLETKKQNVLPFLPILGTLGFLASLYFVYLQLFVLRSICQYCMLSAFTSTTIFVLTRFLKRGEEQIRKEKMENT